MDLPGSSTIVAQVLQDVERSHKLDTCTSHRQAMCIRAYHGHAPGPRHHCRSRIHLQRNCGPAQAMEDLGVPAACRADVDGSTDTWDLADDAGEKRPPLGVPPVRMFESREASNLCGVHSQKSKGIALLSVVIPCYNEEKVLALLVVRLRPVLDQLCTAYEVIFVDDGSTDGTPAVLAGLQTQWPQMRVRLLAANVGHQSALTAGLDCSVGDYVVTMDADLQDPPELIPEMLRRAKTDGVDVVYAKRSDRSGDSRFKRLSATMYYRLMRRAAQIDMPQDVGDFRLMNRRVIVALRALPERHRVYRLLVPWLGYPSSTVEHPRGQRAGGETKYSLRRMVLLAMASITSFSTSPLRVATVLGGTTAFGSVIAASSVVVAWFYGHTVPGWTSMTVAVLFLGAVQLLCLGVLGEYVGRIFQEVQRRPLYTVERDLRHSEADTARVAVHVGDPSA